MTVIFTEFEFTEGQKKLISAAKYLEKRWKSTPIRYADINDKLACDQLIWLVSEAGDPQPDNNDYLQEDAGSGEFRRVKVTFVEEGEIDISHRSVEATF